MIVSRVTQNSAMVCGVFIPRPGGMPSCDWRDFWQSTVKDGRLPDVVPGRLKTLINYDYARAMVFGSIVPKPPTVTQLEWEVFWQARSNRQPLSLTNNVADDVFIRERERTARKPK